MPRYFLHTEHFGREPISDEEGAIFDSVDSAMAEAREGMRELLADAIRDPAAPVPSRIVIRDERGDKVGAVFAKDIVPKALQ